MAIYLGEDKRYAGWEALASLLGYGAGAATMGTLNLPRETRYSVEWDPTTGWYKKPIAAPESWTDIFWSQLFPGRYPEATRWAKMGVPPQVAEKQIEAKVNESAAMGIFSGLISGKYTAEEAGRLMKMLPPELQEKYLPFLMFQQFSGMGETGKGKGKGKKGEEKQPSQFPGFPGLGKT